MKKCPHCEYDNPPQAKFCNNCGENLQGVCPNCGTSNEPVAKFCMECGSKLDTAESTKTKVSTTSKTRREAERRQLTVMFCDLVGSTALSDQLDVEEYREVILDYQQVAEAVIKRYGGHVAQYLGDGLLVYFGYPQGLEDAPKAGVRAGLGILEAVANANQQWKAAGKTTIEVRIGIHTGIVVVDDHLALGDTTNIAARLEGLAPSNGLVISPKTLKLVKGWFEVKSIGEHQLKGIAKPMEVFQVLHESGARTRLEVAKGKGLSPLVGRDKEHQLLRERWNLAKSGKGNLILLNGEAGIGKSRLVDMLKEEIAQEPDSWLTEIRCSSYHQNSSFHPIIELLENVVLQYEQEEAIESKLTKLEGFLLQSGMDLSIGMPLFAEFLSIPSEKHPPLVMSPIAKKQRIMESITQGLLHRAAIQPVLLVVEDLHWADASTLEWLQSFLEQLPSQPIITLCSTRPGFQPTWIGRTEVTQITLHRLSVEEVEHICQFYSKGKALPAEILEQVNAKTEGVPLFVEELTKMILESGFLIETESQYKLDGPLPALAIPSTLQDSLLARLDRMSAVKEVTQLGAVLGREFTFHLLKAILELEESELHRALSQLVEAEILYRIGIGKNKGYQFKHALIQDAAYESMLKSQRQQLHRKVARVLETQFSETTAGQPEQVAHHYTNGGLPLKAIPLWLKAGQLASQKHANAEAIAHLEKGMTLLDHIEEEEERKNLELDFVLTLGGASIVFYGYTHSKVGEIFNRAKEIAQSIKVSPKLALILYNLQTYYMLSEKHDSSNELVQYELQLGKEEANGYLFKLIGKASLGVANVNLGNFELANDSLLEAIELYDPANPIPYELTPGGDVKINAASWRSLSLQISGYADQAKAISEKHLDLTKDFKDSRTLYHLYVWAAWRSLIAKEWKTGANILQKYIPIAKEFGDPFFILAAEGFYNTALSFQGDKSALDKLSSLLNVALKMGATTFYSVFYPFICDGYYRFGDYITCKSLIEESLAHLNETGSHFNTAEFYRIKGLNLQALQEPDTIVEKNLVQALELSRKQSAKTYELRAAADLARLWREQGKAKEGYDLLKGVYDWFTEGFDSVDLREAKTLLDELEATSE